MKIIEKKSFIGKSANYHTEVTATKTEQLIIWISAFICFAIILYSFLFIKNILVARGSCFFAIISLIAVFLIIIFRKAHKNEREMNTHIYKN